MTPSQLQRIAECPTSELLEQSGSSSFAAHRGTTAHRYLANCLLVGQAQALELENEHDRVWLENIDVENLPASRPDQFAPEVAFAFNPWTGAGRELGRNLPREQAHAMAGPGEMVGVADVVGVSEGGVWLIDYKSGRGHVDAAEVNWQIRTYALMACAAYGKQAAQATILRALDDGTTWQDSVTMDAMDLDAHADDLLGLLKKVAKLTEDKLAGRPLPPVHEGPWCTYCPALSSCPPKLRTLNALALPPAEGQVTRLEEQMLPLTAESAAQWWVNLKIAKKRLEYLEGVIRDYAGRNPFALPGGKVLGETETTVESIVAAKARAPLQHLYGEALGGVVYSESVERTEEMTKASLKRALRKYVVPTLPKAEAKITRVYDAAEQELRRLGAMAPRTTRGVKEHRPDGQVDAVAVASEE